MARFEDNTVAAYLEAIANALKAGDMQAAATLTEALAKLDPDAAKAILDLASTLRSLIESEDS